MTDLTFGKFIIYLAVMAGVTYLVRLLPMLFMRKKIENRFIRSILYYMPYSVLTVMTVPAIFYSAPHIISAIAATAVAVTLAYFKHSLITVAAGAAFVILVFEAAFMLI